MAIPKQAPWAILLCKYVDDPNDPATARISDLYAQWLDQNGPDWIAQNLDPKEAADPRTIADVYNTFFTPMGAGTYNAVRYWDEMSHGNCDVSGSRVFPCTLDLTIAEATALAMNPGGAAYQNDIFRRAKIALMQQYGVSWKDFFGVAVSFQSPDYGAQGGSYDGGVGVFMDIRFLLGSGTASWGQEMGHAFGLDHSRLDGSNDDYRDPWDVMSTRAAFSANDGNFGMRGPGLNAWNMRSRHWLDEGRIWKGPDNKDFSELVVLRPLHRRSLNGWLGAEVPGIGKDSAYLVELRLQQDWDAGITGPSVLVHRFEGPMDQFMGTHSYLMKASTGAQSLGAGDHFDVGAGPFARVRVLSIDPVNESATVQLCYSASAKVTPKVKVGLSSHSDCQLTMVEGSYATFTYKLSSVLCLPAYSVLWNVSGTTPAPAQPVNGKSFTVLAPAPTVPVTVTVTIAFDDGTTITDSLTLSSVSQAQASFREFLCQVMRERMMPHPWWEFDPAKLRNFARDVPQEQLKIALQRAQHLVQTLERVLEVRTR